MYLKDVEIRLIKFAENLVDEVLPSGNCCYVNPEGGNYQCYKEYGKVLDKLNMLETNASHWIYCYAHMERHSFSGRVDKLNKLFLKWRMYPEFKEKDGKYSVYFRVFIGPKWNI